MTILATKTATSLITTNSPRSPIEMTKTSNGSNVKIAELAASSSLPIMANINKKSLSPRHLRQASLLAASAANMSTATTTTTKQHRQSLKFAAKNFVTKWAGELEKHYEMGKMIGEGAYGNVYECKHVETGAERAVKVIPKSADEEQNATVIREFNVLKELDHPNALKIYALFESETHFYIVTDLIRGGELYDLLEHEFTEDEVRTLMKSLLGCMNYCHKQNVVHRDLKPENILLEERKNGSRRDFSQIKVIDFGLAEFFNGDVDGDDDDNMDKFTDAAGSSYYMSPQVISGDYTAKCDIWSCGVIAYICLGGYAPFAGEDEIETAQQILDCEAEGVFFDDPTWDQFSDDALHFITHLMTYKEGERPTAEEALAHPWLRASDQRLSMQEASEKRDSARASLQQLKTFHSAGSKLKQCTYSLIASQILRREEKEEVEQMFRTLDADSDGKISAEDMLTIYKEHFGTELSEEDIEGIMYEVNLSGSGAITYSEFVIASMIEKGLVSDHNLELAFTMLDKDQSGFLTFEDFQRLLGCEDDMEDYVNECILKPADLDGDGRITIEEFKALFAPPRAEEEEEPVPTMVRSRSNSSLRQSMCSTSQNSTRSSMRRSVRKSFRASMLMRDESGGGLLNLLGDDSGNSSAAFQFSDSAFNSSAILTTKEPTFRSLLNIFEKNAEKNSAIPSLFRSPQFESFTEE